MREAFIGILKVRRGRRPRLVAEDERGEQVDVAPRQGLLAFPGDRVRVEVGRPRWARGRHARQVREATIVDVLARGRTTLVGRYHSTKRRAWVVPKDAEVIEPFEVRAREDVPEGSMVAVSLGPHPGVVEGGIAAVWTDADSPRALIEQLVFERDLPREFPSAATAEADAMPDAIPAGELARRADLRGLPVIVIDPADAKDHDDAVSWEPRPGGGGRLGVHIADVTWYVRPGSALDEEARTRGVSVYLTDRVLPMLPPRLSADLCSLLAGRDRLARTVFLDVDADGAVRGGEMAESVVRPAASLTYEEAWDVLQGRAEGPFAEPLRALDAVARRLRERRFAAGSLDFNFPETKVQLDAAGEPVGVTRRPSNPAHWLIEECMIAANLFAGERLARQGLGIWRIHEPPGMDDVAELEEFLKGLGLSIRRGPKSRDLHPKDFQRVLESVKGTREEYVVHRKVLQALRLAVYAAEDVGHFGLAVTHYAHFTSPIRRYADVVVHRLTLPGGAEARHTARQLAAVAAQVSDLERRAQEAEWACDKRMLLRYLARRLGETLGGTVSRVERFGAFVELDGLGAEGLLRADDLGGGERFWVQRDGLSMRGTRTGRTFRVGERVSVTIIRVDPAREHVDLALADGT